MVTLNHNLISKIKLIVILVVIGVTVFTLNGCSVSKNKQTNQSRMDSSMSIISEGYQKVEKDSTVETKTKVTELIDTTLNIKGDTVSDTKPIESVLNGDTLKTSENGIVTKVFKNIQGLLQVVTIVKDKKVPIKKTKTTETTTKTVDKGKITTKENTKTKVQVKKQQKNLTVETKTSYWSWWYLLLLLIPIGYYGYKKIV